VYFLREKKTNVFWFFLETEVKIRMSTPPSRSHSETFSEKSAMPASTSVSDQPNLPLLFKYNEEYNAVASHVDENNENEAVCFR
jgi:hypothetical protein